MEKFKITSGCPISKTSTQTLVSNWHTPLMLVIRLCTNVGLSEVIFVVLVSVRQYSDISCIHLQMPTLLELVFVFTCSIKRIMCWTFTICLRQIEMVADPRVNSRCL